MRISDWSSDVCSSDLSASSRSRHLLDHQRDLEEAEAGAAVFPGQGHAEEEDRTSVGSGKSVSVRVALGGRRIIKKKKIQHTVSLLSNQHPCIDNRANSSTTIYTCLEVTNNELI